MEKYLLPQFFCGNGKVYIYQFGYSNFFLYFSCRNQAMICVRKLRKMVTFIGKAGKNVTNYLFF